jgi:hypothetical protein
VDRDRLLIALGSSDRSKAAAAAQELLMAALGFGAVKSRKVTTAIHQDVIDVSLTVGMLELKCSLTIEEVRDYAASEAGLALSALTRVFSRNEWAAELRIAQKSGIKLRDTRYVVNDAVDRKAVWTDHTSRLLASTRRSRVTKVYGDSSSGKSTALHQVMRALAGDGGEVYLVDFNDADRRISDVVAAFARLILSENKLVTVCFDNCQSNIEAFTIGSSPFVEIFMSLPNARLVCVSWPDAANQIDKIFPAAEQLWFRGESLIGEIYAEHASSDTIPLIRDLSHGDVLIAGRLLEYLRGHSKPPTFRQLQAIVYEHIVSDQSLSQEGIVALYHATCLGQFEIQCTEGYLSGLTRAGFDELREFRLLRQAGEFFSVGHKTLCALICGYASRLLGQLGVLHQTPTDVALSYLRYAGERQLLAVLKRVSLRTIQTENKQSRDETRLLLEGWAAIELLSRRLSAEVERDASWGDNIASAVWCAEALSLTNPGAWDAQANYIRTRWSYVGPELTPLPIGAPTQERLDFDQIQERMAKQEAQGSAILKLDGHERAHQLNLDRFHRTWVLGVLLGFEARAPDRDWKRIEALLKSSASMQLDDGAFYPRRVSWVTARVLLGLSAVGHDVRNSDQLRAAAFWLREPLPRGPRLGSHWPSGSGDWNTDIEVTAMVLLALIRSGIPINDEAVKGGIDYLLTRRGEWQLAGKEIDSILIAEVLLSYGVDWSVVENTIQSGISWARRPETWQSARDSAAETQDQSSKAAFAASGLIGLLWALLKRNIPLLLRHLDFEQSYGARVFAITGQDGRAADASIFISHASKNIDVAIDITARFEAAGLSAWIAPRNIAAGSVYPEELDRALSSCRYFALLLSRDSVASQHVLREVERAVHLKKRIFVIRIEDVEPGDGLSFLISMLQRVDYFGPARTSAVRRVIEQVATDTAETATGIKKKGVLYWWLAAGAITMLTCVGLIYLFLQGLP